MQTATIVSPQQNGKNLSGDRALLGCISIIAQIPEPNWDGTTMRECVTVRYWGAKSGNGSTNDASIWIRPADRNAPHMAGYGKAGGYGYHRPSAALHYAIESAGIKLSDPIDAVGETAMHDACKAIATAAGYTGPFLVITHG